MRVIRSKPGMPVWREDEDGRSRSLVITRAGRDAIDINNPDETYRTVSGKSRAAKRADRHLAGAAGHDARRLGESDRLASTYDAGGLDGTSKARLCGRADPERDQGLARPDCEWSKPHGWSLIHGEVKRSLAAGAPSGCRGSQRRARSLCEARRGGTLRAVARKTGTGAARGPIQRPDRPSARPLAAGRAPRRNSCPICESCSPRFRRRTQAPCGA